MRGSGDDDWVIILCHCQRTFYRFDIGKRTGHILLAAVQNAVAADDVVAASDIFLTSRRFCHKEHSRRKSCCRDRFLGQLCPVIGFRCRACRKDDLFAVFRYLQGSKALCQSVIILIH